VLRVKIAIPMSGFFMMPRALRAIGAAALDARLQDPARYRCHARGELRVKEIPSLSARAAWRSKLDSMVALDFLGLVLRS